jgi:hypothetical protein
VATVLLCSVISHTRLPKPFLSWSLTPPGAAHRVRGADGALSIHPGSGQRARQQPFLMQTPVHTPFREVASCREEG